LNRGETIPGNSRAACIRLHRLTLKRQAQYEMSAEADVHASEQTGWRGWQTWHREAQDLSPVDARPYSEHVRFPPVKVSATSMHRNCAKFCLTGQQVLLYIVFEEP
jgi:hypothetical protein